MPTAGPLRSTGITPLPRYYGPLRLPTWPQAGYVFPTRVAGNSSTAPGLPGSSADLSARAVPNHPGRSDGCSRSLLPHRQRASPNQEGWPSSYCVTRPTRIRLRYGSRVRFAGLRQSDHSNCRLLHYLANEQLPGQPPLRLLDQPGLSWRSRSTQIRVSRSSAPRFVYCSGCLRQEQWPRGTEAAQVHGPHTNR